MSLLEVRGLSKAYGIQNIFSDINFQVRRGEKVGLIGPNGVGKTTLVRCLLGFEKPDSGHVALTPGERIGYVEQDTGLGDNTLYEELAGAFGDVLGWQHDMRRLEASIASEKHADKLEKCMKEYAQAVERFERGGGYEVENSVRRVAFGLGFTAEELTRRTNEFSGGQKTRICLARALIRQPDFLFLDEPTNHLDLGMVEWLEEFLTGYSGAVLVISHDRYFLDTVAERILAIENGSIADYSGNYSEYLQKKTEKLAAQEKAYGKQQAFIAKTEEYIDRYRAGIKSKQARGRQSQLSRLARLARPEDMKGFDFFTFNPPAECAERVAELGEVVAGYGDKTVLDKVSLLVRRGDGVALVGPNGAGKTTLLKLLTGDIMAKHGKVKLGSRVRLGYFAQEHETLTDSNSVLDEVMREFAFSEERTRHYLGAFLFRGEEVYKQVGDLSGGEKARLALLKLMLAGANFLILDEPTNHLDIAAREAVEEAIMNFPGTFLTVSHDRYFLDKVANRMVELDGGQLTEYAGNYSYYHDKKAAAAKAAAQAASRPAAHKQQNNKQEKTAQLQVDGKGGSWRKSDPAKLAKKLEEEIAMLEHELAALEVRLNDPASHAEAQHSREVADEYAARQAELDEKYTAWLELTE
ncbi:putative ABC transporter ATP-binding protein YheS [Sporomusa ovata DSM 2662]|uniref:COG0488: ATPase components of ABC transporters with duplicated ATPase domains n=1 Tax=Sporomusa ovata TaxID=2378 RepID=A0A0U1KSR1_9FIRM|nr:ABC-F family ATP-binding cassette domain-containing protein [Sporomusa ovata]EQB26390.1 putative ABC transporter ATP-binding protein YdiF [Sporomusa ovata DSM 2662]CQR70470.1 COG0488: ATPase components of ABC transporters with duplicated ATPase domains [Sporomusa ovata]